MNKRVNVISKAGIPVPLPSSACILQGTKAVGVMKSLPWPWTRGDTMDAETDDSVVFAENLGQSDGMPIGWEILPLALHRSLLLLTALLIETSTS